MTNKHLQTTLTEIQKMRDPDMSLQIVLIPCYTDNYAVLLHDQNSKETICIDAPEARPILSALSERNWSLNTLLITHHHQDHISGIDQIKEITGAKTYGPEAEKLQIPNLDETVKEGTPITWSGRTIDVIETPGHTLGHVCYHFKDDKTLFTGDTLFALGCGRLFEGTPAQMWASLSKIMALPKSTKIYCGHEYTLSNAEFAIKQEPNNIDLQTRMLEIRAARGKNQPTLPTTLDLELRTNPFLRAASKELKEALNLQAASDEAVFTEVRHRKDKS